MYCLFNVLSPRDIHDLKYIRVTRHSGVVTIHQEWQNNSEYSGISEIIIVS